MKTAVLNKTNPVIKFDDRSVSYSMPGDLMIFINEACKDNRYRYTVLPISYDEYDRLMLKPYQYPVKRGVWRLIVDSRGSTIAHTTTSSGIEPSIKNSS